MSAESTEKYKDWILNVIDQLRKRKARPDLERICHFIERKYGLNRKETETHIERLVDMGIVMKVVYKRGTSYRNAEKSRKRSYPNPNVLNSNYASRKIMEAVTNILTERKVVVQKTESSASAAEAGNDADDDENNDLMIDEEGVSSREIECWISERLDNDEGEPFICPIHVVIQREVDTGRLIMLENGNFAPRVQEDTLMKTETKTIGLIAEPRPVLNKSVSVVAKRGRPPKRKFPGLDRSFSCGDAQPTPTPTIQEAEVAPVPVMPPHLCDFCQQSSDYNKKGHEEELLFCKDCNAKAHPSCMQYSQQLAKRARNTPWQCIDCKTCCICADPGEADCMLFCDACDMGYHMMCHEPEVEDKPQGKWICNECERDGVDIDDIEENNNVVDSTVRSTDLESLASHRNGSESRDGYRYTKLHRDSASPPYNKIPKKEEDQVYPNASNWSISDVAQFFEQKGFMEQANAFQEQEIDGHSLLLLKRSDVLQGLSLKLGPALKIYNHVMKLQTSGQTLT